MVGEVHLLGAGVAAAFAAVVVSVGFAEAAVVVSTLPLDEYSLLFFLHAASAAAQSNPAITGFVVRNILASSVCVRLSAPPTMQTPSRCVSERMIFGGDRVLGGGSGRGGGLERNGDVR
jgi:hypothetical protein